MAWNCENQICVALKSSEPILAPPCQAREGLKIAKRVEALSEALSADQKASASVGLLCNLSSAPCNPFDTRGGNTLVCCYLQQKSQHAHAGGIKSPEELQFAHSQWNSSRHSSAAALPLFLRRNEPWKKCHSRSGGAEFSSAASANGAHYERMCAVATTLG